MFYAVIIICLLLYGSFAIMPYTWEIMPELVASGDSIMIIGLSSCIIAAIISILISIFKYFDSFYFAMCTFLTLCLIAIGINSYMTMKEMSYGIFEAVLYSFIFELQFALPIGIITLLICGAICINKKS